MESKSLALIVSQVAALETLLVETGEITPEVEQALVVKDTHLPEKIDNYAAFIERLKIITKYYDDKADIYDKIAKAADSAVEKLSSNLKSAMKELDTKELVGNDVIYKLSTGNPAVVIDSEDAIEAAYKKQVTTVSIDKNKILVDLKLGVPVKGARMQENFRLTKSANRGKR